MAQKVIAITSGSTWTIPFDWSNTSNKIEAIGGGGAGCSNSTGGFSGAGACGGGGGAYAIAYNSAYTPGSSVNIQIGQGGTSNAASGTDTIFDTSNNVVVAKAGQGANSTSGGPGGSAASCIPSAGAFSGGNGGTGLTSGQGSGGGGAGGFFGQGGNGNGGGAVYGGGGGGNGGKPQACTVQGETGPPPWKYTPSASGFAPGKLGSGGDAFDNCQGGDGHDWIISNNPPIYVGSGGGSGGCSAVGQTAGRGGLYGGGGGSGPTPGNGANGIIVITYTSSKPTANVFLKLLPQSR